MENQDKTFVIYEVSLTGDQQNFFTLYRHRMTPKACHSHYIKNLSIDFEEAVEKARKICGPDEDSDTYQKRLVTDSNEVNPIIRLGQSKEAAQARGIMTFGKYKTMSLEDIFVDDKKYVEWVAKGCMRKEPDGWYPGLNDENPLVQKAIALLVGNGDWIERNGKFMSVDRAHKLDYLESLTPDTTITQDQKKVVRTLKLVGQVFINHDGPYGSTLSCKMVDENDHVYHLRTSGYTLHPQQDEWYQISFTANWYNGKLYMKRAKALIQAESIKEGALSLETQLTNKKTTNPTKFTAKDEHMLAMVSKSLDTWEQFEKLNQN